MESGVEATGHQPMSGRYSMITREAKSVLVAFIAGTSLHIVLGWAAPSLAASDLQGFVEKFVGVAWPFFAAVAVFLLYVIGAWTTEVFALAPPRPWRGIGQILHWATEACPLVGLLTTFLSLLMALMAYGEAGPGRPETQAAFISQFAIAFGSSIAGGVLALMAFTLHRLLPDAED